MYATPMTGFEIENRWRNRGWLMHYSRYPARTDACVERSAKEKRLDMLLMSCYSIACHEKRHIVAMLKENRREKTGLDRFKAV